MKTVDLIDPLSGGVLIGLAVTLMLLFNGRVTGISGILSSALKDITGEGLWRWMFLSGLLSGGIILYFLKPEVFLNTTNTSISVTIIAGLLVGFGTVMGSGCTSGHGICGISRLSLRSFIATATFMLFGFFAVQIVRFFSGGVL